MISQKKADKLIYNLCKENGIELTDCESFPLWYVSQGMKRRDVEDCSWIYGCDHIVLGIYTDPELRLISFFHELGHAKTPMKTKQSMNYNRFLIEEEAWRIGIEIATSFDLHFSANALKWSHEQLMTYVEDL